MTHENQFSVRRFRNRNGVFSFRVDGRLNGVRIRRNFKTLEEAALERAALELKGLQWASNLRSVTTILTEEQVREAEAAFRRLADNGRSLGFYLDYALQHYPEPVIQKPCGLWFYRPRARNSGAKNPCEFTESLPRKRPSTRLVSLQKPSRGLRMSHAYRRGL
jgi:hypothetical protein